LKERSKQIEDGKPIDILDNEYEIETWWLWIKSQALISFEILLLTW
jgi:hypothetical protein